jgi:hypothetical protein
MLAMRFMTCSFLLDPVVSRRYEREGAVSFAATTSEVSP